MKNLSNRPLIALVISTAIHGLVLSLFLVSHHIDMTQSHSEGEKTVISIQMYLANVPAVEVSETETAETATPPIVDDNALIKERYIPPSPRKEEVKPKRKPKPRKPPRKTVEKKQKPQAERTPGEPIQASDPVNALEGSRSPSPLAGSSSGDPVSKSSYLSRLLTSIESHKQYPPDARKAEGRSIVSFRIADNGEIYAVSLRKSSGYSVLDAAAISAVKQGSLALPPPADVPRSMNVSVIFSVHQ
ncbi:TPA: energy transducer TonB [Kluyvera cryocrescens]